jgi:hypothetical protein
MGLLVLFGCAGSVMAQTVQPPFNTNYTITDLGPVPGVPTPYGGLTISATDPNVLLIGGGANSASGAIYSIRVRRNDCRNVVGFVGSATRVASAPNIDGGLAFGPEGVLFATTFSNNNLLMIEPGSTVPDRTVALTPLGVASSTGTLGFVPAGLPGAGRFKIASYSTSRFYDAVLTPDGNGTFDVSNVTESPQIQGGPEGIAYVPASSPVFSGPSVLISEYQASTIAAYGVDAQGNPIPSTRVPFITGLANVEGAYVDNTSGDYLFSTFTGNTRVLVVRGFAISIPTCDSIDFNGDGLFPDDNDLIDFLTVLAGGTCSTGTCSDIDFNNDCLFPDDSDVVSFLRVLAGGSC